MSIVSRMGKSIGNIAIRGTGLAALGVTAYDAHVMGKLEADTYAKSNEADRLAAAAYDSIYLDQPSTVMAKMKKNILGFHTDNNLFMPVEAVAGYFKGFGASCINSFVPGLLGLGALLGGKVSSKMSAFGLMLYAAFKVSKSFLGIGGFNRLNKSHYE